MADSKIQIKIGVVEFSGEGDQNWLASQLDKILSKASELSKMSFRDSSLPEDEVGGSSKAIKPSKNLALFLKEKGATTIQTKKFLATAAYLQLGGKSRQTTSDVSKALKDSNQTKLNNPSDCLNQNVKKGFCEKDGNSSFFVTEEGLNELNNK